MKREIIRSERLGESYIRVEHPSGLTVLLYPNKGMATTYALFATKYGSIDNAFRRSDEKEFVTVPEGIAHYLEHKMFDCKDGDAFSKYAKTGANANAYTSFDKTAYLFSCTDNFEESLRILLSFVTEPYFTEASVAKEQGIIGQEIGMYDDDPDWQVYFNLLGALYQKHPLRIDIAGTVETISHITADLLYRCYGCFYNLHNMVLSIAGNFDPEAALRLCDEILTPAEPITVERAHIDEPYAVGSRRVEVKMPVATSRSSLSVMEISYTRMVRPAFLGLAVQRTLSPRAAERNCMELSRVTQLRPVVKAAVPATVSARVKRAPPWTTPMGFLVSGRISSSPSASPLPAEVTMAPLLGPK